MTTTAPARPAFGTVLADQMCGRQFQGRALERRPRSSRPAPIEMHPAAHVLHYASTCFEGFKAYRWADGSVHVFRMDRHIERMRQSARLLVLPEPDAAQLAADGHSTSSTAVAQQVPERAGRAVPAAAAVRHARPTSARHRTPANEATLIVLASPVWDYFAGGMKPLRIYVEDRADRTAAHLGMVKTGGNYAAAMGPTLAARKAVQRRPGAVLPGRLGAGNRRGEFPADPRRHILTRSLDSTFLHGVTRDSLLTMAREHGLQGRGARRSTSPRCSTG